MFNKSDITAAVIDKFYYLFIKETFRKHDR